MSTPMSGGVVARKKSNWDASFSFSMVFELPLLYSDFTAYNAQITLNASNNLWTCKAFSFKPRKSFNCDPNLVGATILPLCCLNVFGIGKRGTRIAPI